MIEEVVTPEGVEAFWSDCQDGEGETFTLPAGDANYTDVIPSATDSSGGADALPALVSALSKVTAERDRARGLAARLEEQLARVEALAEEWRYKGEFGWGAWQEGYGPDPEGMVLDDAATRLRAALTGDGA